MFKASHFVTQLRAGVNKKGITVPETNVSIALDIVHGWYVKRGIFRRTSPSRCRGWCGTSGLFEAVDFVDCFVELVAGKLEFTDFILS